jgi:alkanesulfonate monooxygenase SsuD/methylene tetrahydromethanopterin reductase-like flavin-dependent oxidoreductase (luciferase family)
VAENEAEAVRLAKPAYAAWYKNLALLWIKKGITLPAGYTDDYDLAVSRGFIMAGTPKMVREMIDQQVADCGINYLMCRLAFGDLPYEASARSVDLLAREVMPQVRQAA